MVIVQTMFFNSDEYAVIVGESFPCDSVETARELVKRIYEKVLENHDVYDEERADFEKRHVKWSEDGSVTIYSGGAGYGQIEISDKELVTANEVDSCKFEIGVIF